MNNKNVGVGHVTFIGSEDVGYRMSGNVLEFIPGLQNVYSPANFINDNDWIAGSHFGPSNRIVPYVYDGETVTAIDGFGPDVGQADASGITNTGLVYGGTLDAGFNEYYRFTWTQTGGMVRLHNEWPVKFNDLGDWVGQKAGYSQNVLVSNGQATMLGANFTAIGLNNSRQVLLQGNLGGIKHSLWENGITTRLIDLIAPQSEYYSIQGWKLYEDGAILGQGYFGNQQTRQILLIPVPEPATCIAFGLGSALAFLRRKTRT